MSRCLLALAILASITTSGTSRADEPASKGAKRIVEGRVLDDEGRPLRAGKVMFAPQTGGLFLTEAATAMIDPEGHYRVELADFPPYGPKPLLATGALKYLALSPTYRPMLGAVDAGEGPSTVDIKLVAEPWKTTDLVLVDRQGKPAAGVDVTVGILTHVGPPWSKLKTDAEGRCRIEMAQSQPFGITIRREGSPTLFTSLRGSDSDPSGIKVTLREPIRGRVVDTAGKPVSGVRIGGSIGPEFFRAVPGGAPIYSGAPKMRPLLSLKEVATTDGEGRFVLTPSVLISPFRVDASGEFRSNPLRLTFADEALGRLAFLDVDMDISAAPYEVTLRSTRPVSIAVEHASGAPTGPVTILWSLTPIVTPARPSPIMTGFQEAKKSGEGDRVELHCPPGKYQFQVSMRDPTKPLVPALGRLDMELTVPEGEGPFEVPPARLSDPALQQMVGRPAPEIEATDLDTGKPITLADLRGKVVVIDFWGYWCGPCVTTMPEMAEIQRHFDGKPVVILALHDQSAQSREEYDRRIKEVKKLLWGDKDIPLRIALDRPDPERDPEATIEGHGLTIRRYRVRGFPTLFVIDQEGKVAGQVNFRDHDRLETMIKALLEKAPASPIGADR